ncbi:centrosomal protein cep290-like isoform X3 [Betta splendens]|nr:centrosomal protein cep290-like isoform X3 [Betta splendens]XP_040928577.1 centrosomal protein cep290-like isoform X3 [Betta splendens]XP_040928578.1 centrosomal protein cep290-like isoform X3 [Betta splendens]
MDVTEENVTVKEALEKVAELEYSQNHLRDLNAKMRRWLDVADDDMSGLRSENADLRNQVKQLEKIISAAEQSEAESCVSPLAHDLDLEKRNEEKIQRLEEECITMKEQNKKLTAELNSLQQEREQDKIYLSNFKDAVQSLEEDMKEAQLALHDRDEVVNQKNMELNYLEATVEELSNFTKELKLMNQELRQQLENKQNEALFLAAHDPTTEKEGSPCPHLSFAEEIRLLASTATEATSMSHSKHQTQGEDEEEQLKLQSLTMHLQGKRCAGLLRTGVIKAGLFLLSIIIITLIAFVASWISATNSDLFTINTLWKVARLILQPYCSVHYGALPPI